MSQVTTANRQARPVSDKQQPASPQNEPVGRALKIALDYLLVLPTLVLISPLLLMLALLVKLDSEGPIFYKRRVLGRSGRIFYAYKFRTMHTNGDEILANHPRLQDEYLHNYKLKHDPRVTRIGMVLRKYSLDELPQLLNVVRQEMSLIGPRIITPDEITKYGENRDLLLQVMPGLTGLWQVSGRSNTTYNRRVQLDMEYITNWTIWLDIKIMLRTVPAVLKGDGAY